MTNKHFLLDIYTGNSHKFEGYESLRYSDWLKILKATANIINVDARYIGTHSLRIGGATFYHNIGVKPEYIKYIGRWASDCWKRYIRVSDDVIVHVIDDNMNNYEIKARYNEDTLITALNHRTPININKPVPALENIPTA